MANREDYYIETEHDEEYGEIHIVVEYRTLKSIQHFAPIAKECSIKGHLARWGYVSNLRV